jgi:predicted nucleic acid-binding protein
LEPSIYLETSFLSYVAAQFNENLIALARIRSSQEWWERYRKNFDLCVCQTVVDECLKGHPDAVDRRTQLLAETTLLPITPEVRRLAHQLVERKIVPVKVGDDAVHIACAAVYGCDCVLSGKRRAIDKNLCFPLPTRYPRCFFRLIR